MSCCPPWQGLMLEHLSASDLGIGLSEGACALLREMDVLSLSAARVLPRTNDRQYLAEEHQLTVMFVCASL